MVEWTRRPPDIYKWRSRTRRTSYLYPPLYRPQYLCNSIFPNPTQQKMITVWRSYTMYLVDNLAAKTYPRRERVDQSKIVKLKGWPIKNRQVKGWPIKHRQAKGSPIKYRQAKGWPIQNRQEKGWPNIKSSSKGLTNQKSSNKGLTNQKSSSKGLRLTHKNSRGSWEGKQWRYNKVTNTKPVGRHHLTSPTNH